MENYKKIFVSFDGNPAISLFELIEINLQLNVEPMDPIVIARLSVAAVGFEIDGIAVVSREDAPLDDLKQSGFVETIDELLDTDYNIYNAASYRPDFIQYNKEKRSELVHKVQQTIGGPEWLAYYERFSVAYPKFNNY